MWRFRINRPFLFLIACFDLIAGINIWIMALFHMNIDSWIAGVVTVTILANLAALWRDGVN